MTSKKFVLSVYPDADCHKYNACNSDLGPDWSYIASTFLSYGYGRSEKEAWDNLAKRLRVNMLEKLEYD
jgi:hypothetical protein